jgi:hypothetical protein
LTETTTTFIAPDPGATIAHCCHCPCRSHIHRPRRRRRCRSLLSSLLPPPTPRSLSLPPSPPPPPLSLPSSPTVCLCSTSRRPHFPQTDGVGCPTDTPFLPVADTRSKFHHPAEWKPVSHMHWEAIGLKPLFTRTGKILADSVQ